CGFTSKCERLRSGYRQAKGRKRGNLHDLRLSIRAAQRQRLSYYPLARGRPHSGLPKDGQEWESNAPFLRNHRPSPIDGEHGPLLARCTVKGASSVAVAVRDGGMCSQVAITDASAVCRPRTWRMSKAGFRRVSRVPSPYLLKF